MRKMVAGGIWFVAVACCAAFGLLAPSAVRAEDDSTAADKLQLEFTPYLFVTGIKGSAGIRGVDANLDVKFNQIWDHLDRAFIGYFEARKGPWEFMLDAIYMRLTGEHSTSWQGPNGLGDVFGNINLTVSEHMYQPTFGYRLSDGPTKWDLLAGARYTQIEGSFDVSVAIPNIPFNGGRSLSGSVNWWDPIIGVRVIQPFAPHWSAIGYLDGGVGINPTYQALVGVNWQFAERYSAKFGYRYLKQDYESGGFKWDIKMQGVFAGLGIRF